MPPDLAEVKRWLEKAAQDRRVAELSVAQTPPLTAAAAFHAQQAVEKLLKAYLVWQAHEFEKTHDLRVLAIECSTHDPAFSPLQERVATLGAYAVRFSYPGPADPSVEEVRQALVVVTEVGDVVLARLPREVWP